MLAWLGRHGSRTILGALVLAIALPSLGEVLAPWLTEAVFALLVLAFLRIDLASAREHLRRPFWPLAAIVWTAVAVPLLFALVSVSAGIDERLPALYQGLMLQGIASPLLAAPALAAIMGLDATLVLLTMVGGSLVLPATAPVMVSLFLDGEFDLSPLTLGVRLGVLLGGAAAVGLAARHVMGQQRIARHAHAIDGVNIVVLFVFAVVVMKEVLPACLERPGLVAVCIAIAVLVCVVLYVVTAALFARAGRRSALSLGLMTSQRNMGLIVAGVGGALPDVAWLYFALSQVSIYGAPYLLRPFSRGRDDG